MFLVTGLLTVILVLDCLFLILLVLIQLPKKEAGAGLAFGGAASDALFGAGSGNALTKVTKYATVVFFALLMVIALIQSTTRSDKRQGFEKAIEQQNKQGATALPPGAPGSAATTPAATHGSNAAPIQFQPPPSAAPTGGSNTTSP